MRLIRLGCDSTYVPGDVALIRPQNRSEAVTQLLEILSPIVAPDAVLHVTERDSDMPVPSALRQPLSLLQCAQQYWDLNVSANIIM